MVFFFFKQKTAYEMRISDWSSDVCSSDLHWRCGHSRCNRGRTFHSGRIVAGRRDVPDVRMAGLETAPRLRSEEHTSELQSLMRISYAVFCLKKKNHHTTTVRYHQQLVGHSTEQSSKAVIHQIHQPSHSINNY